ncbi:MAG: GNAT family N-acetyltransferase [Nitrospirota bacterium]|nr:GNAT family N-acetyltransferase [Nitrospirota bacterium]MDP2382719.1 GNAT family N-acetyltransferase [Nitrospirota bacterium]
MVLAEIHRGRAMLSQLKADWDRLVEHGNNQPSASFEWTEALMESHVQESDDLVFVVLRRRNTVIGIVPLVLRPMKQLGQTVITAFPVSELSNTHSDLLIEEVSESVLTAFVDALYCQDLRWDVFNMTRLLEGEPLGELWCRILRQRRKAFEFTSAQPSFFLRLDQTFEGYLRRRSSSFRNALKRTERKLMSQGRLEIRNQGDFTDIDEAYQVLLSIEHRSWKQAHGTSIAAVSRQTVFYRYLCERTFQRNWLHLGFLFLDDRPIAYNLGLIVNDTYFYLKTSYDYAERPLSPSTFLRAKLVEELIGRGVRQFDFPAEPYEWESQWTDEMRWHRSLTLFAPSAKGFACRVYRRARAFLRESDCHQVQYVNPRDSKSRLS